MNSHATLMVIAIAMAAAATTTFIAAPGAWKLLGLVFLYLLSGASSRTSAKDDDK